MDKPYPDNVTLIDLVCYIYERYRLVSTNVCMVVSIHFRSTNTEIDGIYKSQRDLIKMDAWKCILLT